MSIASAPYSLLFSPSAGWCLSSWGRGCSSFCRSESLPNNISYFIIVIQEAMPHFRTLLVKGFDMHFPWWHVAPRLGKIRQIAGQVLFCFSELISEASVVTSCLFPTFYHPFSSLFSLFCFLFPLPLSLPLSQLALSLFSFCLLIASFSIRVLANTQHCCPPAYTIPFVSLNFQQAVFSPFENGHNYLSALGSLCLSHCVSPLRTSLKLHNLLTSWAIWDLGCLTRHH